MYFDLNVNVGRTQTVAQRVAVKEKLVKLGYGAMVWNRNVFGKLTNSDTCAHIPMIAEMDTFERSRPAGPVAIKQFSRITVHVDDMADTQVLAGGNSILQTYDIVAVCPTSLRTFNYVCANSEVDIITVDYSRKIPFHMPKKALDQAIKRGVCLEILYGPAIKGKNPFGFN